MDIRDVVFVTVTVSKTNNSNQSGASPKCSATKVAEIMRQKWLEPENNGVQQRWKSRTNLAVAIQIYVYIYIYIYIYSHD